MSQTNLFDECNTCHQKIDKSATLDKLLDAKVHDVNHDLLPSDKEVIQQSANRQEKIALAFFKANPDKYLTAEEVHVEILKTIPAAPITSARRSCTNLMNDGLIAKHTDVKKMGSGGVMICTYKLIEK